MDTLTQSVTQEIRAEMARQGLSQQDLAARLVWGRRYLGRRITGEVALSLDDLEEIAAALQVPTSRLMPHTALKGADR